MLLRDSPMTRQGPKGARVPALPCIIHILRALVTTRLVRLRRLLRGRLKGICGFEPFISKPNLSGTHGTHLGRSEC